MMDGGESGRAAGQSFRETGLEATGEKEGRKEGRNGGREGERQRDDVCLQHSPMGHLQDPHVLLVFPVYQCKNCSYFCLKCIHKTISHTCISTCIYMYTIRVTSFCYSGFSIMHNLVHSHTVYMCITELT